MEEQIAGQRTSRMAAAASSDSDMLAAPPAITSASFHISSATGASIRWRVAYPGSRCRRPHTRSHHRRCQKWGACAQCASQHAWLWPQHRDKCPRCVSCLGPQVLRTAPPLPLPRAHSSTQPSSSQYGTTPAEQQLQQQVRASEQHPKCARWVFRCPFRRRSTTSCRLQLCVLPRKPSGIPAEPVKHKSLRVFSLSACSVSDF